jgi:uncharacterized protein YbjT (DUF2867 family)
VYVDDVAAAITQILRQSKKPYPVYELAGPRVYSYEELLRTIARIAGLRPVLMQMPFALWDALAGLAEMLRFTFAAAANIGRRRGRIGADP